MRQRTVMELTRRVEIAAGRLQYRAFTRVAVAAARLHPSEVQIDGVRVPFYTRGWGVPVVLVHGFGGDKENWIPMAASMRSTRAVVIPDLPGFGDAGMIDRARASAEAQSRVLAALFDHLGIARAHLVGNSMGGGIALRFARDFPARTTSLTLVGSVGPVVVKSEFAQALDRGENPLVLEREEGFDDLLRLVAERVPPAPRAVRRYLGADRVARQSALRELFDGWIHAEPASGVPEDLREIRVPTLVVHGERDRVIHPSTAHALAAQLPNARLEMMPGVGHIPQFEAPRRVARAVEAFVDEVEQSRGTR